MPHSYGASFSGDGFFGPRKVVNTITNRPKRTASVTRIKMGSVPIGWDPSFLSIYTYSRHHSAWCHKYTTSHRMVAQGAKSVKSAEGWWKRNNNMKDPLRPSTLAISRRLARGCAVGYTMPMMKDTMDLAHSSGKYGRLQGHGVSLLYPAVPTTWYGVRKPRMESAMSCTCFPISPSFHACAMKRLCSAPCQM